MIENKIEPVNQLQKLVEKSGLEKNKADVILNNFNNYFRIAAEWEQKSKAIVVSGEDDVATMKMAREGRLFLKNKRVAIEKSRIQLKEQSLREGKAIDGIANVLKALIVPVEDYLKTQEDYAKIKEAERREKLLGHRSNLLMPYGTNMSLYNLADMDEETFNALLGLEKQKHDDRVAAEKKAEAERIAKEKAEAEERRRIRAENERLKKEAEDREHRMEAERKKAEAERQRIAKEKEEERKRLEEIAKEERKKRKKLEEEKRKRVAAEKARLAAEKEAERKKKAAPDKEKMTAFINSLNSLEIPTLSTDDGKRLGANILDMKTKMIDHIESIIKKW